MPINHDAAAAIAHVPLRGEILIPGAVVLGIGGTRRCGRTPNGGISGLQCAVGHNRDRTAQGVGADIGVASRMGSLRTIAAVHHQINQAVATPHNPHMECKNVVARDSSEINLLPVLGVRGAPNLDATPGRLAARFVGVEYGFAVGHAGGEMDGYEDGEKDSGESDSRACYARLPRCAGRV